MVILPLTFLHGVAGGGGGDGAVMATWTEGLTCPPGPVAVRVYVVDSSGVRDLLPFASTLPTPGSRSRSVAFCEVQVKVTDWPRCTLVESTLR